MSPISGTPENPEKNLTIWTPSPGPAKILKKTSQHYAFACWLLVGGCWFRQAVQRPPAGAKSWFFTKYRKCLLRHANYCRMMICCAKVVHRRFENNSNAGGSHRRPKPCLEQFDKDIYIAIHIGVLFSLIRKTSIHCSWLICLMMIDDELYKSRTETVFILECIHITDYELYNSAALRDASAFSGLLRSATQQERSDRAEGAPRPDRNPRFGSSVLRCIEADFCNWSTILRKFSRSTICARVWTAPNSKFALFFVSFRKLPLKYPEFFKCTRPRYVRTLEWATLVARQQTYRVLHLRRCITTYCAHGLAGKPGALVSDVSVLS